MRFEHVPLLFSNTLVFLTLSGPDFSRSPGPAGGRGEGSEAWMPKIKVTIHQPIEMKLCMSQYSHESMPDAQLSLAAFLVWRYDVIKFPSEEGNES